MNNLVMSIFSDESKAEEARRHLLTLAKTESLDLEDALILKKDSSGRFEFRHIQHHAMIGAVVGAFWGLTFGIVLLNPLFALAGLFMGFFFGALIGSLSHVGVDTKFVKEEATTLPPGSYAVCALAREDARGILREMEKYSEHMTQIRLCSQKAGLRQCSIQPVRRSVSATA